MALDSTDIAPPPTPLVDFLICGVQKASTTSLHGALSRHPQLFLPERKELHFFDRDRHFEGTAPNYPALHVHFEHAPTGTLRGEATPIYCFWAPAMQRIHAYNPGMRLIMVLRNPAARAFSHWNMERVRGREPLSFMDALIAEEARAQACLPRQDKVYSYLARGRYGEQIRRILNFFPADHLHLLLHEDLCTQPAESMKSIFDFLGIDGHARSVLQRLNANPYESKLRPVEHAFIMQRLDDEIRAVEVLVGRDLTQWRRPPRDALD